MNTIIFMPIRSGANKISCIEERRGKRTPINYFRDRVEVTEYNACVDKVMNKWAEEDLSNQHFGVITAVSMIILVTFVILISLLINWLIDRDHKKFQAKLDAISKRYGE